ncbi:hypothetical protein ACTFIV_006520 [Dictyostelium citrinum]
MKISGTLNKKIHYLLSDDKNLTSDNFSCPLCNKYIYDSDKVSEIYQCKEGHWGCKKCWNQLLETRKECKICKCKVESIKDLSRSRFIENGFSKVKLHCPNSLQREAAENIENIANSDYDFHGANILFDENGCQEVVKVEQLQTHLNECKYAIIKCSNDIHGCSDNFRLKNLGEHLASCEYQLEICPNCKSNIIRKSLNYHIDEECLKTLIQCLECNSNKIERGDMTFHLDNDCPDKIIECILRDTGCYHEFKRSHLPVHLQSIEHISKLNTRINELNEKIISQDKEITELNQKHIQISNQLKQNEILVTQTRDELLTQKELANLLISRQEKFESQWEVSNFSKREYQKNSFISSPVIRVGHHEFQLWLYPNGETNSNNLALYLVLTKGERTLVNFSVSIKNNNSFNNLNSKFENDKYLEVNGKGWGWGFEKNFINDGYLQNDTLSIDFTINIKKQPLTTDILL